MREADFQGRIVPIVFDVSFRRSGEGFFIMENLRLEGVQGIVKQLDSYNMFFLLLLDRSNERVDDVDKKDGVVVV